MNTDSSNIRGAARLDEHPPKQQQQAGQQAPQPPPPRWQQYRIDNTGGTTGRAASSCPADVVVDRRPFECLERLARVNTAHYQRTAGAAVAAGELTSTTHPNSNVPATEPIGVFHTTAAVDVPLYTLVARLCRETSSAPAVGLLALLLVVGVLERTGAHVTENMTARMVIAAVRVASKFCEDRTPCGADFASAAGIVPRELMRLESTLLHGLDWRVLTAFGETGGIAATASVAMLEDDASDRIMALATADPTVPSLQHADLRSAPGTPIAPGLCTELASFDAGVPAAAVVVADPSFASMDNAYVVQTATRQRGGGGGAKDADDAARRQRRADNVHRRDAGSHRSSSAASSMSRHPLVATPIADTV